MTSANLITIVAQNRTWFVRYDQREWYETNFARALQSALALVPEDLEQTVRFLIDPAGIKALRNLLLGDEQQVGFYLRGGMKA